MGPEEFTSREELGHVLRYVFAKAHQQAETIAFMAEMFLTDSQIAELADRVMKSPRRQEAKQAREKLDEFLEMHNIVRRYQTPPEE
jgi:hypothetical protein